MCMTTARQLIFYYCFCSLLGSKILSHCYTLPKHCQRLCAVAENMLRRTSTRVHNLTHTLLSTHSAIFTLLSMSDCATDSSGSTLVYNVVTSASVPPLDSSRDTSLGTALDIPTALSLDLPSRVIACPTNSSSKALVSNEWVEGDAIARGVVMPHGVEQRTYFNFINLPTTDSCCSQVDIDNRL
jgi:hypothetical protein